MKCSLILLMSAFSFASLAQTNNAEIIIDFKNKNFITPLEKTLRKSDWVYLTIKDIPTGNYKVSINKTDSFINVGKQPALFDVFNFGTGFNSLLTGLSAYTSYAVTKDLDVEELKREKSKPFKEKGNLKTYGIDEPGMVSIKTDPTSKLYFLITKMRKQIFDFHFGFRDEILDAADKLKYEVDLNGKYDTLKLRLNGESIIKKKLYKEKELEQLFLTYYDAILQIQEYAVLKSHPALITGDSMIVSYKRNFNLFINKFDSSFNRMVISTIYKQLSKPKPDTFFTSFPYKIQGDITKFDISITAIDPVKTPQSYTSTIELNKYPNRILSFTTGVFLSGLKNMDYAIVTNVKPNQANPSLADTSFSIQQENNNTISTGINALVHIGTYFGDHNEKGAFLAFGPGLTLEKNPQVRLLLGGGFMFGRTNKLTLSFGWAGGSVKRLSSSYNESASYKAAPKEIIRDQFKSSWFASIGYSIFNK